MESVKSPEDKRSFRIESNGAQITIYNLDCLQGMRNLVEAGSVDVVVTSPPYNIGVKYGQYDDTISRGDYLAWMLEAGEAVKRCLKDEGSFFLNIGSKPSDLWIPFEAAAVMRDIFQLQNVIHWIKSIAIEKSGVGDYPGITQDIAVGHYKPVNSKRYLHNCQEYIFHFTKSGDVPLDRLAVGVKYQDKSNIARWGSNKSDLRCRGNTWFIPYKTIQNRNNQRPHPASFPPKLPEMCIKLHGLKEGMLVMDPFNGIGNTALACRELGVDYVGFEVDEEYFGETIKKLLNCK